MCVAMTIDEPTSRATLKNAILHIEVAGIL